MGGRFRILENDQNRSKNICCPPRYPCCVSEGLCVPSLLAERGASSAGVGLGQCPEGLRAPSLRTERGASATLPSLPSLPLPRLAVRGCPPGVSAVGSPAAGGVAGDCGPGHYPPLPHAYPGGASCSFPLFKNPRPWVECATVVGVSFLRGPLESLLAGRPARLPPRW